MFNPIHLNQEDQKYYFWDETQADRVGPFLSYDEVYEGLEKYCRWLSTGKDE